MCEYLLNCDVSRCVLVVNLQKILQQFNIFSVSIMMKSCLNFCWFSVEQVNNTSIRSRPCLKHIQPINLLGKWKICCGSCVHGGRPLTSEATAFLSQLNVVELTNMFNLVLGVCRGTMSAAVNLCSYFCFLLMGYACHFSLHNSPILISLHFQNYRTPSIPNCFLPLTFN